MRRQLWRWPILGAVAAFAVALVLVPAFGQTGTFGETFDGSTPATPAPYTNPHNWSIFTQGFNANESGLTVPGGDPRGGNLAQHGPNCEPPGFPYTSANSHVMTSQADAVFICGAGSNTHLMTSPGLTGYGAIYMQIPAVADIGSGSATITWDMSTLRTSARDWVDVVLTPWDEQSQMAYNNNDQHIPIHNIHVEMQGTNVFMIKQRVGGGVQFGQGSDVQVSGDTTTTYNTVLAAQSPPLEESASRRDTFQITLSRTNISLCMPQYSYGGQPQFCWVRNAALPVALDPSIWDNHVAVMFNHRAYNPQKACIDTQDPPPNDPLDSENIDHTAYGEQNCPNDTWHWDNVNVSPAVPMTIIKSVPEDAEVHSTSSTTVNFASASVTGSYLAFVTFSHTPDLEVSYNGGSTWHHPDIQPAIAPNNGASEENGEAIFDPMPSGVSSIRVRGSNGFWGDYASFGFHIVNPPSSSSATPTPTPTPLPATATPTRTPTPIPGATNTPTPVPGPSYNLFASTTTSNFSNDTNSVNVGVKFRSDQNGQISGLRFLKGSGNTGTHVGSLWSATGTLLAQATFTGETSTGWQSVTFSSPVSVTANTLYVASYLAPNGRYAQDQGAFASSIDRAPLHAPSSASVTGGNGVYIYGASSAFPTNTYGQSNYWVDVTFASLTTPTNTPTPAAPTNTPTATPVPPTPTPTPTPSGTLCGNTAIESADDYNAAGQGQEYVCSATTSGTVSTLHVYLSSGSVSGSTFMLGLYTSGTPHTRLASCTITGLQPNAWNSCAIPPTALVASQNYYLSTLQPNGQSNLVHFRDRSGYGSTTDTSSQTTLSSMPTTWSIGTSWNSAPASLYAD